PRTTTQTSLPSGVKNASCGERPTEARTRLSLHEDAPIPRSPVAVKPNARSKGPRCRNRKADERQAINDLRVAIAMPTVVSAAEGAAEHPRNEGQDGRLRLADSLLFALKNRSQHHLAKLCREWTIHPLFDSFNFLTIRDKRQR